MRRAPSDPGLIGRADECGVLDGLLDDVRRGESRSLILRGDAGIGKTALLRYLIESASDFSVARAVGVESEMELAFAALHQICAPMLDRLPRLPAPQRDALEIVFGLSAGAAPDRFLVGLATLSLFAEAADDRPLLCVVDDAQWLDHASALTLAFVARRLIAAPVGIVLAAREPGDELQRLSELAVHGLGNGHARALLSSAVRTKLDERVRDRIIAETQGNPLALLELPRGLTATELAGGFGLVGGHGRSGRIEERFARRLASLGDDVRRLLLLAAADPVGDPLVVWRAAEGLRIRPTTVEEAEAQGLLAIGQRVAFVHPPVRSAVYRAAPAHERREVHRALAHATDAPLESDRRAWHLAAAALGPDEKVASELERSAGRAHARGGFPATAAFLNRSVALTQDPARRIGRALAAAAASLHAGAFDAALDALSVAEAGAPPDELQRARVDSLRGQIALASGSAAEASPLLLSAARRLQPLDVALARETYLGACGAAMFAGPSCAGDLRRIGRTVGALPRPAGDARAVDVLLDGLAVLITEGRAAAAPTLLEAVAAFMGDGASAEECVRWGWMAAAASNALWDDDGLRAVCLRQIQLARDAGALQPLPNCLVALASATARSGDFDAASALVAEANAVIEATGTRLAPYAGELLIASLRGSEADVAALERAAVEQAARAGQGIAVTVAQWASAILFNGLGRYEDAVNAARRAASAEGDLFAAMWALPELIEAATRAEQPDIARDALARLAETTQPARSEFGLGIEARSRALLAEGDAAEHLYREAIERLRRTRMRADLARAHLLYGEWLRRAGRRTDAREQLTAAHELFTAMDMAAFAERTRRERLATGERLRRRSAVDTRDALTPQEAQIARLARDGLSNPEIGARLFLSPRTVEWHLKKVFAKLGISSRRELWDTPPSAQPDAAGV